MKIKITEAIQEILLSLPQKELKYKDYYLHFVNQLINKNAYTSPVHLSSIILRRIYGRKRYLTIINFLTEVGIIKVTNKTKKLNNGFIVHVKYFSLINEDKTINYIITNQTLLNNIDRSYFNVVKAHPKFINQMKQNIDDIIMLPKLVNLLLSEGIIKNYCNILGQHKPFANHIKRSRYGRIFNSMTKVKRNYRNGLIHQDGSKLIEIDAKNAQLICLYQMAKCDDKFKQTLIDGNFYETVADKMGIDISTSEQRDKFKEKIYNTFIANTKKGCVKNSPVGKAMFKLFPEISDYVINMNGSKAGILQHCESKFFINTLCSTLIEQGIWVASLHDAIIIKQQDYNKVINDYKLLSSSYFGFEIKHKVIEYNINKLKCTTPLININSSIEDKKTDRGILYGTILVGCSTLSKNDILKEQTITKIIEAVDLLNSIGEKISIRKVMKLTGLSNATVQKHKKLLKCTTPLININGSNNELKGSHIPTPIIKNEQTIVKEEIVPEIEDMGVMEGIKSNYEQYIKHENGIIELLMISNIKRDGLELFNVIADVVKSYKLSAYTRLQLNAYPNIRAKFKKYFVI